MVLNLSLTDLSFDNAVLISWYQATWNFLHRTTNTKTFVGICSLEGLFFLLSTEMPFLFCIFSTFKTCFDMWSLEWRLLSTSHFPIKPTPTFCEFSTECCRAFLYTWKHCYVSQIHTNAQSNKQRIYWIKKHWFLYQDLLVLSTRCR